MTVLSASDSLVKNAYDKKSPIEAFEKCKLEEKDPIYIFIQKDKILHRPIYPLKLTDHVIELLILDNLYNENDSFSEVVQKTQKQWLSVVQGKSTQTSTSTKTGIERNDLKDTPEKSLTKVKVESIARAMGLFGARNPTFSTYKYSAWLGGYLLSVRNSLQELVKIWESGCRFEKLIVFTGERYLRKGDGQEDDIKKLIDPSLSPLPFKEGWKLPANVLYETEYDMMRLVFEQTQLPTEMAKALQGKIEFINAPKGQHLRPGTKDCYMTWLKTNPERGTVLATSFPLYWVHQQIAGEAILGEHYPLDTVAPAVSDQRFKSLDPLLVSVVHDTVAKCLYEIGKGYDNQSN